MRNLTAILCLTLAVLVGSAREGFAETYQIDGTFDGSSHGTPESADLRETGMSSRSTLARGAAPRCTSWNQR
jgi:hypothetical protein